MNLEFDKTIADTGVAKKLPPKEQERVDHLFQVMKEKAVTSIMVSFSGSGDSGQYDEFEWEGLHREGIEHLKDFTVDLTISRSRGQSLDDNGRWVQNYEEEKVTNLEELAEAAADAVLGESGVDWYNNDGGFGKVLFNFTPEGEDAVLLDINQNYTESTAFPMNFTKGLDVEVVDG